MPEPRFRGERVVVRRQRDCRMLSFCNGDRGYGTRFFAPGRVNLRRASIPFGGVDLGRSCAWRTTVNRPGSKSSRPIPPSRRGFGNVTASSRGLASFPRLLPAGPALRSRRVDRVTNGTERRRFRSCRRTGGGVVRTFRIDADSRWGNGHRHCLCRHRSKRSSLVASSLGGNPERRIPHSWSIAKPSIALQWGASDSPAAAGQGRTRR